MVSAPAAVLYRAAGILRTAASACWRAAETVESRPEQSAALAAWSAVMAFRLVDALAPRQPK